MTLQLPPVRPRARYWRRLHPDVRTALVAFAAAAPITAAVVALLLARDYAAMDGYQPGEVPFSPNTSVAAPPALLEPPVLAATSTRPAERPAPRVAAPTAAVPEPQRATQPRTVPTTQITAPPTTEAGPTSTSPTTSPPSSGPTSAPATGYQDDPADGQPATPGPPRP